MAFDHDLGGLLVNNSARGYFTWRSLSRWKAENFANTDDPNVVTFDKQRENWTDALGGSASTSMLKRDTMNKIQSYFDTELNAIKAKPPTYKQSVTDPVLTTMLPEQLELAAATPTEQDCLNAMDIEMAENDKDVLKRTPTIGTIASGTGGVANVGDGILYLIAQRRDHLPNTTLINDERILNCDLECVANRAGTGTTIPTGGQASFDLNIRATDADIGKTFSPLTLTVIGDNAGTSQVTAATANNLVTDSIFAGGVDGGEIASGNGGWSRSTSACLYSSAAAWLGSMSMKFTGGTTASMALLLGDSTTTSGPGSGSGTYLAGAGTIEKDELYLFETWANTALTTGTLTFKLHSSVTADQTLAQYTAATASNFSREWTLFRTAKAQANDTMLLVEFTGDDDAYVGGLRMKKLSNLANDTYGDEDDNKRNGMYAAITRGTTDHEVGDRYNATPSSSGGWFQSWRVLNYKGQFPSAAAADTEYSESGFVGA